MGISFKLKYAVPDRHYGDLGEELKQHLEKHRYDGYVLLHNKLKPTPGVMDAVVNHLNKGGDPENDKDFLDLHKEHLTDEHISSMLDMGSTRAAQRYGATNAKTSHHVEKVLAYGSYDILRNVIKSPGIEWHHLSRIIRNPDIDSSVKHAALRSLKTSKSDIEWAADKKNHDDALLAKTAKDSLTFLNEFNSLFQPKKINESLDSTISKTEVPDDSMLHQMGAMSASMIGGSNFKMHKLGAGYGYLLQFDKDGATEVHHVDENLQGGYVKNNGTLPYKFVSTAKKHIQSILDTGKPVRLAVHGSLSDQFKSLSGRILARSEGYSMTDPVKSEHELTGDPIVSWVFHKNG